MADITQIKTPSGDTYNIKDSTARSSISGLAPKNSPTFTGTPTAPTPDGTSNDTQIATTAFVKTVVSTVADAMVFKGTLGTGGTVTALPTTHSVGWAYKVITAGTYAGKACEVGDLIICIKAGTVASNDDWTVVQSNLDGAVTGPASAVDARVAVFNGTSGKIIKDSGFTIGKSVPSDAKFTDTTYSAATQSAAGLMSSTDKTKLDGIATGATANTGTITGITMNGASKGTSGVVDLGTVLTAHQDISGKVSGPASATNNAVAIFDGTGGKTIKNSGYTIGKSVPSDAVFTDTTYSAATQSADGLMSSTDKTKLDGIATGATANTGTITGIKMNGASKGTSGVVDLGTVLTAHQDISGKKNTQSAVSDPTASGTSLTFIATISQNAQGVISPAKKTVSTMGAATSSAAGTAGLVPAPAAGNQAKYLKGDGTWSAPVSVSVANEVLTISLG